ncbi:hypothetical protein C8J56DRAFT_1135696 [Mycena floridula]|nr:hypothetical protein C8J56DRAFT_1135696 [Mycena floridula]
MNGQATWDLPPEYTEPLYHPLRHRLCPAMTIQLNDDQESLYLLRFKIQDDGPQQCEYSIFCPEKHDLTEHTQRYSGNRGTYTVRSRTLFFLGLTHRDRNYRSSESKSPEMNNNLEFRHNKPTFTAIHHTTPILLGDGAQERREDWTLYTTSFVQQGITQWQCMWKDNESAEKCDYWGKKQLVKRHIEGKHLRMKPFRCNECPAAFSQKGCLDLHLRSAQSVIPLSKL